jgi:hypothetical protein
MNIFQNTSKSIPMDPPDEQIVRVSLDQNDIGGRKSHLPKKTPRGEPGKNDKLSISHLPNMSTSPGQ